MEEIIRAMERKVDGELINPGNSEKLVSFNVLAKTTIGISGKELAIEHDRLKPTGTDKYAADKTRMEAAPDWTPEVSMEAGVAEVYE